MNFTSKYIDILLFSFSEIAKTFGLTLLDSNPTPLCRQGIKLNGLGLYLNPGTEVFVCVNSGRNLFNEKVSVPVTSCTRKTKLMFERPVEFPNFPNSLVNGVHGYNISLSVQVTGKGSAMSTKDGEEIERTARLETAIGERQPIQITNCKNSIIGELYFTSPPN